MIDPAQHLELVYHAANRYRHADELADIEGAGCVGLMQAANAYREDSGRAFSTFAYYRIRGEIVDHLRRWHGRATRPEWSDLPGNMPVASGESAVLDRVEVEERIAALPPVQREIVIRFFLRDESLREIAATMGVTGSRVCQIKRDALRSMRGTR